MFDDKTIFVVDDDIEVCKALHWLFESVDLKVETYDCVIKFLLNYDASRKGCLILDVRMPIMTGIELLERLQNENRSLPTIIMSGYGDIPMAVKAMKKGAVDFIIKPINDQYLLDTLYYYLEKMDNNNLPDTNSKFSLTKREEQVLNLIIDGKLNKQIANELQISISTVEVHRSKIMRKFGARNLVQLVKHYFNIQDKAPT